MTNPTTENFGTAPLSKNELRKARALQNLLVRCKTGRKASVRVQLDGSKNAEPVAMPAFAVQLLQRVLDEVSHGRAVELASTPLELTTQQAAETLGVSRPYVVKLIDAGEIPARRVGKYRRVRRDDLMAYKRKDDAARVKALNELAAEGQRLGLGY